MKQLLIFLAGLFGLTCSAQTIPGMWEVIPNFGATAPVIVETPEYVYVFSGTSLIGYDKATDEIAAYNTSHRLNGNAVKGIWYDPQAKYLFVTYTDYNIDLLFDDGRTVNVPDLRDAAINTDKTINGVAFYDNKAYVASNSGLLVIDAQYGAVTESCLWGKQINQIAATPAKLLIYYTGGDRWYVADRTASHHNFDKAFARSEKGVAYAGNGILSANGKIGIISGTTAYLVNVNDDADNANAVSSTTKIATGIEKKNVQVTAQGFIFGGSGSVHRVNAATGEIVSEAVAEATGNSVAGWNGDLWLANVSGFGKYTDGTISRLKPNATSGTNAGMFRQAPDGTVYIATAGVYANSLPYGLAFGKMAQIDKYSNGTITPYVANTIKSLTNFELLAPTYDKIITSTTVAGASIYDADANQTHSFTPDTSPLHHKWVRDVKVSDDGSAWFLDWILDQNYIMYLYKAKPGSWEGEIDPDGWSYFPISNASQNHSSRMVIDEARRNIVVAGSNGLEIIKMPAAVDPLSSDLQTGYCSLTIDEDGNSLDTYDYTSLVIDKQGWLWIGNHKGIYVFRNTDNIFAAGSAPMRPKVARNDGTNLADYLLDQVDVSHIAVDENNDKWISTIGSGLYHVSADGTEIIEHFTAENSQLPSNNVLATLPDRFSNKLFVGTEHGLAIYHSTSSPAKSNLNDVYAYPNPVTPEYTGHITIAGLMDGTLVKIADAAGNVFFHGTSRGGMLMWNGCDSSGRRVKSGVYFVFASKTSEGEAGYACVTKIVVVN